MTLRPSKGPLSNCAVLAAEGVPGDPAQILRHYRRGHARARHSAAVKDNKAGGPAWPNCSLERPNGGGLGQEEGQVREADKCVLEQQMDDQMWPHWGGGAEGLWPSCSAEHWGDGRSRGCTTEKLSRPSVTLRRSCQGGCGPNRLILGPHKPQIVAWVPLAGLIASDVERAKTPHNPSSLMMCLSCT